MSTPRDKDLTFLRMAHELGKLGTCDRARVGCIITKNGRAISWGYNGALPSMPHCEENGHGWGPSGIHQNPEQRGCINVIHAEANAICFAARQGISTEGCTLYVERSPCLDCSRFIIASGIECVVTSIIYRDPEGWNLLDKAGVERRFVDSKD